MISLVALHKEGYYFVARGADALYIHKKTMKMTVKKGAVKRLVEKVKKRFEEEDKGTGLRRIL